MLTKQLALEYASAGVRINAICPGFIETPDFRRYVSEAGDPDSAFQEVVDLHPMGRVGRPREIADGVVYPRERRVVLRHRSTARHRRRPADAVMAW